MHILGRCSGTMRIADDVAVFGKIKRKLCELAQPHEHSATKLEGSFFSSRSKANPDPEKIAAISQLYYFII